MKQKYARLGMLLLSVIWVGANLLLEVQFVFASSPAKTLSSHQRAQFAAVTPTPTPPSGFSLDSTIIAAIIGAVAVVLAAIIGGAFIVYQVQKNHKLELEKLRQQSQSELQKMRYGERLNAEREEQERERQRNVTSTLTVEWNKREEAKTLVVTVE
jgi:uncharacterized protein HemX